MRTAAHVFYLAVFSLLGSSHAVASRAGGKEATESRDPAPNVCEFEPGAIVSDACASYSALEHLNEAIHPYLHTITQDTDFFSHYRLNLYNKKCPFWSDENGMCGNIACAVNTLENEEDIPLVWRAAELGKLEGPTAQHPGKKAREERKARPLRGELGENVGESCVVEYDDECDERDYCVPDDEGAIAKGDYVSLVDNPERFTGYAGVGSQQVWEAIYRENCFRKPLPETQTQWEQSPFSGSGGLQAAQDLKNVMKEESLQRNVQSAIAQRNPTAQIEPIEFDDECIEKRVFYRVVSGMHASISTHLCWEYLNQSTGQWGPNLECYEHRLHNHPERISNLYFNYALVSRAVGKIRRHIKDYSFCSADPEQDQRTKEMVLKLASSIPPGPQIFDESVMFQEPHAAGLKEDFRNRFRNVSRIMDCVGCDKCRLWGKLQTAGYGTALKVLFEFNETDSSQDPPLRRTELVALVNTFDRLSHSLAAVKEFRRMIEERDRLRLRPSVEPALPSSSSSAYALHANEDDGEPEVAPRKPLEEMTVSEMFWDELSLVMRAVRWIILDWIHMPAKLGRILVLEIGRLWDYWLGLPMRPRSWEWHFPTRDEL